MTTTLEYQSKNGASQINGKKPKVHVRVSSSGVHRLVAGLQLAAEVLWLIVQTVVLIVMGVYKFFFPGEGTPIDGKVVLITGAGHGLGRELSIQFARQGCTIICVDINKEGNDSTVKDIQSEADSRGKSKDSAGRPRAVGYICNVASRHQVMELAKRVESEVGEIDILVNNAGILTEHSLHDATPEEIQNTIDVNFTSHFWTMQSFVPSMWRRNAGRIVAIASVGSFVGVGNFSTYCATKYAVLGLMNSLHEEFRAKKKNIKLTTVHPYFINTRPDLIKGWHHRLPLITPERVATAVVRAVRRDNDSVTIPKYLYILCVLSRLVPQKVVDIWRDVFYTTIVPPNKLADAENSKAD